MTQFAGRGNVSEFLGITYVPATDRFVVKEKFRQNFITLSGEFERWFIDKIEPPRGESALVFSKLLRASIDNCIVAEFGSADNLVVTLAEIFLLLQQQSDLGKSVLLSNGIVNIFYVRDRLGVLRSVDTYLDFASERWVVSANALGSVGWVRDAQVFSRVSAPHFVAAC